MNYKVSQLTCLDTVKTWEGLRLKQYKCPAGIPTIGYGNTGYPKLHPEVKEITMEQADELLRGDLETACSQLNSLFEKDSVNLNINQFSACVSFVFNIGIYAFSSSRAYRMCIKLDPNNFEKLKPRWLQWCHVGTTVLKGLLDRRIHEFDLYCTPVVVISQQEIKQPVLPIRERFREKIRNTVKRIFKYFN